MLTLVLVILLSILVIVLSVALFFSARSYSQLFDTFEHELAEHKHAADLMQEMTETINHLRTAHAEVEARLEEREKLLARVLRS